MKIVDLNTGEVTQSNNPKPQGVELPEVIKKNRIAELKQLLRETDYVALSDYDQEKIDVIAQRATWRAEVRELESD